MTVEEFLKLKHFPQKIIFAKLWGSRSHNTELPTSDWDFSGVYLTKTRDILSFRQQSDTLDGNDPDYQLHEAGKFCTLLLKGNPAIIEMLFTEKMCFESPEWLRLKSLRKKFLSKQVVEQYIGYATGQLRKLQNGIGLHTRGGKYSEKWAYHLVRLLQDALRIVRGGYPIVWKDNSDRDFLMRIRNEKFTWKEIEVIANNLLAELEVQKPWMLPDQGDADLLEEWLVTTRLKY
jgi:uncharacterized protein